MESQTNQTKSFIDFQINKLGFKLQRDNSNPKPLVKLNSNTMLNDQLSLQLKLIGFGFNMNIMLLNNNII